MKEKNTKKRSLNLEKVNKKIKSLETKVKALEKSQNPAFWAIIAAIVTGFFMLQQTNFANQNQNFLERPQIYPAKIPTCPASIYVDTPTSFTFTYENVGRSTGIMSFNTTSNYILFSTSGDFCKEFTLSCIINRAILYNGGYAYDTINVKASKEAPDMINFTFQANCIYPSYCEGYEMEATPINCNYRADIDFAGNKFYKYIN